MISVGNLKSISGIRDNCRRGAIGDFLRKRINAGSNLSFVSAYFTIYAYKAMKTELDGIDHLRFLFGEPRFIGSIDLDKAAAAFRIEDDILKLANTLEQKYVAKECSDWLRGKVDVRSIIKPGFLHGKMYHMDNDGVSKAIVGSSNFTVRGLGLSSENNNIELNLEVNDNRDLDDLKNWFDEVWEDENLVEDVKDAVLSYLAKLYKDNDPEFVYFKTLFHIFEDYLSEAERGGLLDEKTGFFESNVWEMLYDFQKDGVKGAINKILKHNGCIIADSVGLGKTFEALAVIKYFELLNGRVLVLCPKKLEDNWKVYRENDTRNPLLADRFAYTVLAHTDLGRDAHDTHNWGNYDLVVIDESHNFRNNACGKEREDGTRRITRYEFLMEQVLKSGVDTKVMLLSATPVNNSLKDLRNQFLLITQNRDDAFNESLDVSSITQVMKNAQTHFTQWADPKKNPERKVRSLLDTLDSTFFKLLDELTISRSRRHVVSYYGIKEMGKFPERLKPMAFRSATDIKGDFPSYDDLHAAISEYKLTIFNPTAYLKDDHVATYVKDERQWAHFNDQRKRESYLIGMMRTNYLKRLESSVHSFEKSIDRTIKKIDDLLEKIDHFEGNLEEYTKPDLFTDQGEEEDAELMERLTVGKKLSIQLKHLRRDEWKNDLEKDREQLFAIHEKAVAVTPDRDAKLRKLKKLISEKVKEPINENNRKILVFTAFSDTARYLYENLNDWVTDELDLHCALVTGGGDNRTTFKPKGFKKQTDFLTILTNFSPRSKNREKMRNGMPQKGEIDVLIATDCISEGQNLQDCDYVVNYDIHWNPVRIIQRFGRIDRLGSTNKKIQLVNFWPTDDLNKYINLKDRVEARMAMVDIAASGADNLLDPEQFETLLTEELTYREKQLLRLKDEVLDLEDMDGNVSLSEFTLDDFRIELLNYLETNRKALADAPLGLYAVTPTLDEIKNAELFDKNWREIVKPGIIFCLRHKNPPKEKKSSRVNPLGRYYLLYIRNDGTVRFTFTQAKNVLSMLQKLCVGKDRPYQTLCDLFDQETEGGTNMDKCSDMLSRAVNSIVRTFRKRTAAGLQSGRNFVIPDKAEQATGASNFELITWLVIK